ncbi:MAG: DUF1848 domain-containing protein [archaeon]
MISASRRTDIPAFLSEWFLDAVRQGSVGVKNPFSPVLQTVSLRPESVSAIVFWSKNYQPFFPVLNFINPIYQKRFLFHYTINGYAGKAKTAFEPHIPNIPRSLSTLKRLSERYGKEAVIWRFDPLVFSNVSSQTERLDTFNDLCALFAKYVDRCIVSFVDLYQKVRTRFDRLTTDSGIQFIIPTPEQQTDFLLKMKRIADAYGIHLSACCENDSAVQAGIPGSHCVDAVLLKHLFPDESFPEPIAPTRKGCGCYLSQDIGAYNTCNHHCAYCYANR